MSKVAPDPFTDEDYFERGPETGLSHFRGYSWGNLGTVAESRADWMCRTFPFSSILDVGCAKGLLVLSLQRRGRDAWGVDASKYAVDQAEPEVKVRVMLTGAQQVDAFAADRFDMVCAWDVLEHLSEPDVARAVSEMRRLSKKWVLVNVPTEDNEFFRGDRTHRFLASPEEWCRVLVGPGWRTVLLARHGVDLGAARSPGDATIALERCS